MRDLKTLRTQKNPQHKFPQEASGTYSKLEFQALSVVFFFFFFMHCSIVNGRNKITLNMSSFIIFDVLKLYIYWFPNGNNNFKHFIIVI